MRFTIPEKSLFSRLTRAQWWLSVLLATLIGLPAHAILPERFSWAAIALIFPFIVSGLIAAYKQWKAPHAKQIDRTVNAVSAMPWSEFSALIEKAFQRDGFIVTRLNGSADFSLSKDGRTRLISAKRWKAAKLGIESLRELESLRQAREVDDASFVSVGTVSENAERFALEHDIHLVRGFELTQLLRL